MQPLKVTITIKTNTPAFFDKTRAELARILETLSLSVNYGNQELWEGTKYPIFDADGRTVGTLTTKELKKKG